MRKEEYMKQLREALNAFDAELAQEITADYEERFRVGMAVGKSEEEVIRELGSVEELIEELSELQREPQNYSAKPEADEKKAEDGAEENRGSKEKDFTGNLNEMLESIGKIVNMAMKEAGEALDFASVEISNQFDKAKKKYRRYRDKKEDMNVDIDISFDMDEKDNFQEPNVEQTRRSDENCKRIVVDADIANVNITASEDATAEVSCYFYSRKTSLLYPFYSYQEGDTFYVGVKRAQGETQKSGFFQVNATPSIEIELTVPAQVELLEVRSLNGDIGIDGIQNDTVKIKTTRGDVTLSDMYGKKLTVDTASGDCEFSGSSMEMASFRSASGDIVTSDCKVEDFTCVSNAGGDITVEDCTMGRLGCVSTSGDVDVTHCKTEKLLSVLNTNGDTTVDDCMAETLNLVSKNGDIEVSGCSGGTMNLMASNGDIDCTDTRFKSGSCRSQNGEVNLESVSGNIKVEC